MKLSGNGNSSSSPFLSRAHRCLSRLRPGGLCRGFTLIELLLVVAIIGLLASVVIQAVNPQKMLLAARDDARKQSVSVLQKALMQALIDSGSILSKPFIKTGTEEVARPICKQGVTTDPTCINFDNLIPTYLAAIPQDAREPCPNYSGYKIARETGGRPLVAAARMGEPGGVTNCLWSGLVGFWPLGGSTDDVTVNENSGTLYGSPVWVNGRLGKALQFNNNGNDYALIIDDPSFNYANGMTYAAWIYPTAFPTLQMFMGEYLPYFGIHSSRLLLFSVTAGVQQFLYGTTALTANRWYHVAATYDASGFMRVYLNGVQDAVAGPYPALTDFGIGHYIGRWMNGTTYPFSGVIDDVRIYNRALSASEIASLAAGATD